jgi:hypothetical protein
VLEKEVEKEVGTVVELERFVEEEVVRDPGSTAAMHSPATPAKTVDPAAVDNAATAKSSVVAVHAPSHPPSDNSSYQISHPSNFFSSSTTPQSDPQVPSNNLHHQTMNPVISS